jgi:catechol 2,3-dioxygenase-like lactoylglutathione lyase family enzyme
MGEPSQVSYQRVIPVLPALDTGESVSFYRETLGFTAAFDFDDYAGVTRDGVEIHFWKTDDKHLAENSACRIHVDDVDPLWEAYKDHAHENGQLSTEEWGKEFAVLDPSGNLVWFQQPMG